MARRTNTTASLMSDILAADSELQSLLCPLFLFDRWKRISELRIILENGLSTLLVSDLKFCQLKNIEQHVWKKCFYNIIELLRGCINEDHASSQRYKLLLLKIVEEGTEYFANLIKLLEKKYKFNVEYYFYVPNMSVKELGYVGLALISAQKIYTFLGDLARYKELVNNSLDFSTAKQWYTKARLINPRNGKPYNQLALLSVYKKNMLDAVYYYMRSIAASNTFSSAKESLKSIFDENKKKYERLALTRNTSIQTHKEVGDPVIINGRILRREIWIHPDNIEMQSDSSIGIEVNEHFEDICEDSTEITKRFLLTFLYVHGKLFSKIGVETLEEAKSQLLRDFEVLLNHSPLPLKSNKFLQLLALNMNSIHVNKIQDTGISSSRSLLQESALILSLHMFGLIIEKCISYLKIQFFSPESDKSDLSTINPDINILLSVIMVWCDWLWLHYDVWNPPPSCKNDVIDDVDYCWKQLASLASILQRLNYEELMKQKYNKCILIFEDLKDDDCFIIKLPEDIFFAGFSPLMNKESCSVYTYKDIHMETARICLRIHKILSVANNLCSTELPILQLNPSFTDDKQICCDKFLSAMNLTEIDFSNDNNLAEQFTDVVVSDEVDKTSENIQELIDSTGNSSTVQNLLNRRDELEYQYNTREKHEERVREIMKECMNTLEIVIKPRYLIPDTNCFIDFLDGLLSIVRAISKNGHNLYFLVIPLVVLSELQGLSKDDSKNPEVNNNARKALNVLYEESNSGVKYITTLGSLLTSATFTSEDDYQEVGKNDDKILQACRNLSEKTSKIKEGESGKLYSEVVLLTADRNLRVKALSYDMPVKDVTRFLRWAKL